jgi:hypothetical protein
MPLFVIAQVTIGGSPCTGVANSQTSLTCTAPAGSGANRPVVITWLQTDSAPSAAAQYSYTPPAILGAPITANPPGFITNGGVPITILGTNFGTWLDTTVTLQGIGGCPILAAGDIPPSRDSIICRLPPGAGLGVLIQVRLLRPFLFRCAV